MGGGPFATSCGILRIATYHQNIEDAKKTLCVTAYRESVVLPKCDVAS